MLGRSGFARQLLGLHKEAARRGIAQAEGAVVRWLWRCCGSALWLCYLLLLLLLGRLLLLLLCFVLCIAGTVRCGLRRLLAGGKGGTCAGVILGQQLIERGEAVGEVLGCAQQPPSAVTERGRGREGLALALHEVSWQPTAVPPRLARSDGAAG